MSQMSHLLEGGSGDREKKRDINGHFFPDVRLPKCPINVPEGGGVAIIFFLVWFLPWWYLRAFAAFGVIHPSNGSSSSRGNTQWVSCLRGTLVTRSNLTLSKSRTFYWQDTVSKRWLDFEHEVKETVRCKHRQMIRWLEKKRWSWCLSTHPCGIQWRCATIFVWGATYGGDYNYYRWLTKQDRDITSGESRRWDIWVGH